MMKFACSLFLLSLVAFGQGAPTSVAKRASSCGQWDSVQTGKYTVYNNLWGESSATSGSECFSVNSLNGDKLSWQTT